MARCPAAAALVERFCRPQRVGVFGHRGVGKTTLLTMLYREAVGGRLPGLRLAAADARTADYLSDKILQLESGRALPGTLAETDLRFHLYHGDTRLELLLKDYQGEHVSLGRRGPIQEFLADCDAVWLCLDLTTVPSPAERLWRQQEIEQLIEEYLAAEPQRTMDRPAAILLTKVDLLGPEPGDIDALADTHFGMTRHALRSHCPHNGLMAVSSLGSGVRGQESGGRSQESGVSEEGAVPELRPMNLGEPLSWLAAAMQAQDEARLERLWSLAGSDVRLLERCINCFVRRYPQAAAAQEHQRRLRELKRTQRRRRALSWAAAAAGLVMALWSYDAYGYRSAAQFEAEHADDPAAVLANWQEYEAWHPTRHLTATVGADDEEHRAKTLTADARQRDRDARLADLRRHATDPDADPEALWKQFQDFRGCFPEVDVNGDLHQLRAGLQARREEQRQRHAQRAYDELTRNSQRPGDLMTVVAQADRYLRDYPDSAYASDVRNVRAACLLRLDEQDIHDAREYSVRNPLNFQTRREKYQAYLDKHPNGGACTEEARKALKAIEEQWDRHDFRALRDQFVTHPGDVGETVAHCRRYLAVHPGGKFRSSAVELLRWTERVTVPGEYKVTLKNGSFDSGMARFFSRGLKLSVELEVNGVRHGPSTIIRNSSDPEWNYEFPRAVRWKLGDPVRIYVTDHTWKDRVVVEISSPEKDPLGMKLLSGEACAGPNRVTFTSDFKLPKLPEIE